MTSKGRNRLVVDEQFKEQIPPLSQEERQLLEANISEHGCLHPLVAWAHKGKSILLDGHHRHDICERLGIPYAVTELSLPDRAAAEDWIDRNQLGRRNLTPDQFRYFLGRLYNRVKKAEHDGGKGKPRSGDHNEPHSKTAERLAADHGVSPATVKRAAKFAEQVDANPVLAAQVKSGQLRPVDANREAKRQAIVARLTDTASVETKAIQGVYDVLVIDPPWPMEKIERDVRPNQVEFDYPTMSEGELASLHVPAADDCHVWLWTTHRFLPMAFKLLQTWGLKYVCTFVWHKPGGFQPVGLPQFNCEFCLYARKGTPAFIDTKALPSCFSAPRGKHSEKPEEFYETLRRVTAGRRLDMFNRRPIAGFDAWGKEATT